MLRVRTGCDITVLLADNPVEIEEQTLGPPSFKSWLSMVTMYSSPCLPRKKYIIPGKRILIQIPAEYSTNLAAGIR